MMTSHARHGSTMQVISALGELEPGMGGAIERLGMGDPRRLQKLMAMGLLPGTPVKLLRRSPSFVLQAGYSLFAVDQEIAAEIFVRVS